MEKDNNKFSFTYSAPTEAERREIESIRRQYRPDEKAENKVERLRALHSKVAGRATAASLAVGVIGLLIFGLGMALALEFNQLVVGIAVSVIGAAPMAVAFPLYNAVINRGKQQYGDEIIRLSDELLGEDS